MKYYQDFQVGESIRTQARTITETDIVNFCMFSGDWFELHSDAEAARRTPYKGRIAHGLLVLSAVSGLMPLYDWAIAAFYGMDRLRFVGPTRIGDTIHLEMKVAEKKDKGERGGVVGFDTRVVNQNGEEAAVYLLKIAMRPRPTE